MNRPKRAASQKAQAIVQTKQPDLDLSDVDDEDSDGDFSSQSSDDYNPNDTTKNEDEISEESEVGSDIGSEEEEEDPESSPEKHQKTQSKFSRNNNGRPKKSIATLRKEVLNKFRNSSMQNSNSKLQDVFKKAEFQKHKSIFSQSTTEDDNAATKLSDTSDSEDDNGEQKPKSTKPVLAAKKETSVMTSEDESDNDADTNLQKMREIAEKLADSSKAPMTYKSSQKENMNVADLLAMGEEGTKLKVTKKRARASQAEESDSDNWEDVEDDGDNEKVNLRKENVEIILNEFGDNQRRDKSAKPVDVEAQLKRKINRARKEHQERLHKSQLLAWIGHCNFVNTRLNDMDLIKNALKLLPKGNQCYPTDKTDAEYFKQITTWFKHQIKLNNKDMYCMRLKKRPPLMMSLALQMKFKKAICRRDYVLIFVILLRAIGIQCRMVQSINCEPKNCPKTELMSVSTKSSSSSNTKSSSNNKSKSSSNNKSKSSSNNKSKSSSNTKSKSSSNTKSKSSKRKEKIKIPQLDGGDIEIPVKRSTRNTLKTSIADKNGSKETKRVRETVTKITVTADSPNRIQKPPPIKNNEKISVASKLNRALEMTKEKATLNVFSPRKTRSMSRDEPSTSRESISSKNKKEEENVKKTSENIKKTLENSSKSKKDTLKIVLPRSTRSRSKSNENENKNSPNLKKLAEKRKATDDSSSIPSKSRRESKTTAKTSSAKENELKDSEEKKKSSSRKRESSSNTKTESKKPRKSNVSESSEGSLKYFKSVSKTSLNSSSSSLKQSSSSAKASTSKLNIAHKDRRVLSSDDEEEESSPRKKKKQGIDIWVEVYAEKEERWLAIDVLQGKVDCPKEIAKKATHPLTYVFAWNNDNSIKDISARYIDKLNSAAIRKTRVDREYLNSILHLFSGIRTARDFKEDTELNDILLAETMPTSIAEFKNHPLYALKRHLLKFEAIYPPEPPILGYIRDEAIYPRDSVFTCRSRETWLKEARVVKLNEKPYKITKTMKYDRVKNKLIKDVPLEIFGIWQTKDYEPPIAENGIVPRNAYGNVELFKKQMLPINTVHIQLPGLNKVCRKLGIDCAQAVVGFDSNGGWPYPVYDGFVVCKEFEEKVIDAWNREQDEAEKKEREKIDKRVYGNWKKLIKGLLIRERLKIKYNFEQGK